jgi:hypothetical protein
MPNQKVRTVGSNYTTFRYQGKPLAFLQSYSDSGVQAMGDGGQAWTFVTPLGNLHPIEIANSSVLNGGTLQLSVLDLWEGEVWEQLQGLAGAQNITDVWALLAQDPSYATCQTIITPPGGGKIRGKTYHNCKVVGIQDDDNITLGALVVAKGIVVAYTHSTKL